MLTYFITRNNIIRKRFYQRFHVVDATFRILAIHACKLKIDRSALRVNGSAEKWCTAREHDHRPWENRQQTDVTWSLVARDVRRCDWLEQCAAAHRARRGVWQTRLQVSACRANRLQRARARLFADSWERNYGDKSVDDGRPATDDTVSRQSSKSARRRSLNPSCSSRQSRYYAITLLIPVIFVALWSLQPVYPDAGRYCSWLEGAPDHRERRTQKQNSRSKSRLEIIRCARATEISTKQHSCFLRLIAVMKFRRDHP